MINVNSGIVKEEINTAQDFVFNVVHIVCIYHANCPVVCYSMPMGT